MKFQKLLPLLLFPLILVIGFIALILNLNTSEIGPKAVKDVVPPAKQTTTQAPKSAYVYPLPDYAKRLTVRKFGQYFTSANKPNMPCGQVFVGYHDGDDLEALPSEENSDVPVFAVASGKVVQVGHVSGYGGLLVQSANLNGEPVTIYYGHVSLASISKKVGDDLTAGEQVALLGKGCSSETDGERKHLHFAIKKGTGVDVRGYVPSEKILSSWVSPLEVLSQIVK